MAATELALNTLIDEYTLQGAKGLLVNITGGDIPLFEVDAVVNEEEVDEAELIFGAIKDENMNGKIRVSIVATSLKGSNINTDPRPVLNVVNGLNSRTNNFSDNLFSKNNIETNVVNSIDGANALKLDESFEIKNSEEQSALIDSFESDEENKIVTERFNQANTSEEFPTGVSIESASYMEKNEAIETTSSINDQKTITSKNLEEEYTPKLFSEDSNQNDLELKKDTVDEAKEDQLFDQDPNEDEDFEIPAFLRRQKF